MRRFSLHIFILLFAAMLASCSATKYVPEGEYLLDNVRISTDTKEIKASALEPYVRQNPNSKLFSLFKTQLYIYNLSGEDSARWVNRMLRKVGDAPAIYDVAEAERTQKELRQAVRNMGYLSANVSRTERRKRKKIRITYNVEAGEPYRIGSMAYNVGGDSLLASFVYADTLGSLISLGSPLDVNVLDAERQRVTSNLTRNGYYRFNKEFIRFAVDTVKNSKSVALTMNIVPYQKGNGDEAVAHKQYYIDDVVFITDYDMRRSSALASMEVNDSIHYKGVPIYYSDHLFLRPKLLTDHMLLKRGDLYNDRKVQRMYSDFARLNAVKYTNIRFFEGDRADTARLNCYVMLTPSKHKSVSFEVEGTNSAGDLGAAASLAFNHRNIFRGSENLMVKLRGAYEAISGLQGDYSNNNYVEYGVETSINFPSFIFPFISSELKHRLKATTELALLYNYQLRPEFSRTMASASWGYKWTKPRVQHKFDLIDIAYLYLPWISSKFREDYIDKGQNYIFEYNYKNRLIVHTGYSWQYNSSGASLVNNTLTGNAYSIRFNAELAGNLLYLISKATNIRKNSDGEYSILGIPYAQYAKADIDFAKNIFIDNRNSLAFHVGLGVAVPYGNAKTIPFEKQYFGGGANGVRGWSVRELGPGSFAGDGNLLNQSGDIRFLASVEYRSKLFWKFQGAAFVDAGNIWTIREYENQPGGVFRFNSFYKQIAAAYGLGLRLDLDFFIIRFDGGMKAINPVYQSGRGRWPIIHPDFSRDFAFHFAVGYPF
jgi:outer membrane protein assembly factor BamA